ATVTGVQTCALPIYRRPPDRVHPGPLDLRRNTQLHDRASCLQREAPRRELQLLRVVENGRHVRLTSEHDARSERLLLRRLELPRADDLEDELRETGPAGRDRDVDRRALLREDEVRRRSDSAGPSDAALADLAELEAGGAERGLDAVERLADEWRQPPQRIGHLAVVAGDVGR